MSANPSYRVTIEYSHYGAPWAERLHNCGVSKAKDRKPGCCATHAHPAKFSRKQAYWILGHGREQGWWEYGDLILDPMAGVGCGGIAAVDSGMRWVGIELETTFLSLAWQSARMHWARWHAENNNRTPPYWIAQGDAREIGSWAQALMGAELVGSSSGKVPAGIITSPPYGNRVDDHGTDDEEHEGFVDGMGKYGNTDGQLGNARAYREAASALPTGIVTSPPLWPARDA